MKLYFDFNDWWIGYYRGTDRHYICIIPTLVLRVNRKHIRESLKEYKKEKIMK